MQTVFTDAVQVDGASVTFGVSGADGPDLLVLHGAMLAASDFMGYWFDHDIAVGVPSETTYGPSMYVEQGFEDHEAFIAAAEGVRDWMRRTYME